MSVPRHVCSPAVQRCLEAQARNGHASKKVADRTLGDRIKADQLTGRRTPWAPAGVSHGK